MQIYHLFPNRKEGWKLTAEGSSRALDLFRTKAEGVLSCEEIIRQRDDGGCVEMHRADGTIEEERIFPRSADPAGSRGGVYEWKAARPCRHGRNSTITIRSRK